MSAASPVIAQQVWLEWQRLEASQGAGALLAAGLQILLLFLLKAHDRKLLRLPATLLGLHLLFIILDAASPSEGTATIPFDYLALFLLLCSLGQTLLLSLIHAWPARLFWPAPPRIVRDFIHILILVAALLITLDIAGVDTTSLVGGTALITAAIGLSLKDSLGNLFAGLAIQLERPFEVGDWIQFDPNSYHIGKVLEINWRATKLLTLDDVVVVVPNGELAQTPMRNFSKPDPHSRRSVYVVASYDAPPREVQEVILAAIVDSWGVLPHPPPSVVTNSFNERGVEYWVRFFTVEFAKRDRVDGGVRDRIWYALQRRGLAIPGTQHQVQLHQVSAESRELDSNRELAERRASLGCVDFLAGLPAVDLDRLALTARRQCYFEGEDIIRQGEHGEDLFIIQSGEVEVSVSREGGSEVKLGRLGPGHFFGEMSLMTGQPRAATVTALRNCVLFVIDKEAMRVVLADSPGLVEHISETLSRREMVLQQRTNNLPLGTPEVGGEPRLDLLRRIKEFFSLTR